jgi:hypothetical protein
MILVNFKNIFIYIIYRIYIHTYMYIYIYIFCIYICIYIYIITTTYVQFKVVSTFIYLLYLLCHLYYDYTNRFM